MDCPSFDGFHAQLLSTQEVRRNTGLRLMFLLEIYGVKSYNELVDISNPSSGNASYFSLSRAIERSSFTSVTSCFMLLYWIYRFLSFDRGHVVGFMPAVPGLRVVISISQQNTNIIYASFSRASHVSWDSVLPGYINCCRTHPDDVIQFSRGPRDQVSWFTPSDKVRGIAEQSL